MKDPRYLKWEELSNALQYIDINLIGNVQGLGLLDVDLIKEFPKLKMESKFRRDKIKRLRHITLSELWVFGTYEFTRLTYSIARDKKNTLSQEKLERMRSFLETLTEIRVPLAKFQQRGKKNLFTGIASFTYDSKRGIGWRVTFYNKTKTETKLVYRMDLGDSFLSLLEFLKNGD